MTDLPPLPPLAQEWFSASELAAMALPDLPTTARGIAIKAERSNWGNPARKGAWWRERAGRGGGIEYHVCVLPRAAQAKICLQLAIHKVVAQPKGAPDGTKCAETWAWFDRQTDAKKAVAMERLQALHTIRQLTDAGVRKVEAAEQVSRQTGVALSTLYAWEKMVHRVPRSDWLPFLAPRHAGQTGSRVAFTPEAWDFISSDYLRPERPTVSACYRRLVRAAQANGWTIPCERTVARKLDALPSAVTTLARKGRDALKAMYPAQQRDRMALHALEVVNADFHKWDVFVRFPNGEIDRPQMIAFQDIYSGKLLSWRIDLNPNKNAVRLAFGDLIERYGVPSHCVLDNGREFASKWITGTAKNRYRFKVKDEDPQGLLVALGVEIHWATPYAGQSKPIERMFRDFAGDVAKHPAFAGAYVGNSPMAKPENYRSTAVPFDRFLEIIQGELAEHNARRGRTSDVCRGRSFDEVFAESYAASEIRKATADQRRLWLLAAEAMTVNRTDGTITLGGNRFWTDELAEHRGQKVTVRFDPDRLQDDIFVYRMDGAFLCKAPCQAKVGFLDQAGASERARNLKAFQRASRELLELNRKLRPDEIAAILPAHEHEPALPETKVVRPLWGNTARQLAPDEDLEQQQSAAEKAFVAASKHRALRVVGDDD
jgi:transposase InsO family protein